MAEVTFAVQHEMPHPAKAVFDALVDWPGHADWVPMTRVQVLEGTGGVGTTFVATTGLGPLGLADRMRVTALDPDRMHVQVVKIGPILTGEVTLSVTEAGEAASRVDWVEDIHVPWLPQFAARPVGALASAGFRSSLRRLSRRLSEGAGVSIP